MLRPNRGACATLALVALASLTGAAAVDAHGDSARQRDEHRSSEREHQTGRREAEARQRRATHPVHAERVHAAARRENTASERPVASYRREAVARSIRERRVANGSVMRETHFAGAARVHEVSGGPAGGPVRVVRYGNALSGTVDHTIRPGLISRTFVSGGRVAYTRVYQRHVWHSFGRAFAYEAFVPAVRYPAVYYAWALAAWPRPVVYRWGWQVQPWYPAYGYLFTPYPVYTSPDLWMTDYIIAQSLQAAYQTQTAAPAPEPSPDGAPPASAPYSSVAPPPAAPDDAPPPRSPPASDAPPPPSSDAPPAPPSSDTPSAPVAAPPAITPQVKAELNAQIKVRLEEQQSAAATPATLTTQNTPPALRPNHVFFQVVQSLEVSSGAPNRYCSLRPNDYIRRIGGMSNDDWMIPVVVELSGPSDCPEGLQTRIGLNDLSAMENEQQAQLMEAMQAASRSMGPNGPPSGPGAQPTLIADGSAAPDPSALDALRQAH